jgi:hypothetical protein
VGCRNAWPGSAPGAGSVAATGACRRRAAAIAQTAAASAAAASAAAPTSAMTAWALQSGAGGPGLGCEPQLLAMQAILAIRVSGRCATVRDRQNRLTMATQLQVFSTAKTA